MSRSPRDISNQVAVLGASADIASEEEIRLAGELGRTIALRGLTCVVGGDDGVMGAAARAARAAGGDVIAILARDKKMADPTIFTAVIDTGLSWGQFSDVLLRSVRGAIAIGGGAGTLAELATAYLSGNAAVILGGSSELARQYGGRPLDQRNLARLTVADEPLAALDLLLAESEPAPDVARTRADDAHFSSYPFGSRADYLPAAHDYVSANESTEDVARYHDALADYFYYTVGDYLRAATHYLRARDLLRANQPSFSAYLTAIALESVGMALARASEYELASTVSLRGADAYEEAISVSPENEHHLLRHSSAGLHGDSHLFAARAAYRNGKLDEARGLVRNARASYEEALSHHTPYGDSVSSSSFERAIAPVVELENLLAARETVDG